MSKQRSILDFQRWKREGRRFAVVTAYDAPSARIAHQSGVPMLLVGDSLGNVVLGHRDTRCVTLDEMVHHGAAVRRGAPDAFVVGDLPFLTYHVSPEQALISAGRFVQQCQLDAVKLEGGRPMAAAVERIVQAGIPVMGHIGLTPQSVGMLGGFRVQGTEAESACGLLADAHALAAAGAFALVLECVPLELARCITTEVQIPTIGIGAGPHCDAQVLVLHDLLGIEAGHRPRFVRRYAQLEVAMREALERYVADVSQGQFPSSQESFSMSETELKRFEEQVDAARGEPGAADG